MYRVKIDNKRRNGYIPSAVDTALNVLHGGGSNLKTLHSALSPGNHQDKVTNQVTPQPADSQPPHKKPKILVIDDEAGVCDMILEHFSLRGYEVFTAEDGVQGIEVCARLKPDVILLDLKMKVMDGDKAIPKLREIVPQAKIFVISAYQDEITQKRIAGLNVDGYFEKPVSILELQNVIQGIK